ncbi:methylmalonyl-CoA mutase [Streptosporangiaceae bacterium NEAU-GS5]|nr:methylmalonyl-CoA mutase [Streptosporangiaceae bacterium NEAU-GS5]
METREQWLRLARAVLGGRDLPEFTTYDGIRIAPLYDSGDLPDRTPRLVRPVQRWDVRQRHAHPDPAVNREAILADLASGVTSIWLDRHESLDVQLAGVPLGRVPIAVPAAAGRALLDLAAAEGVALPGGDLGGDPHAPDIDLVRRCLAEQPAVRAVLVDATPYHDAGGADADELGCALAHAAAALRALTGAGVPIEDAFGQIAFRYAATDDQFLTIAKLRAARRLWARVAEACDISPSSAGSAGPVAQFQHAVTSSAMMTARDPWVNMLRTTVACFAAGAGGADAITVQPFDACLGLPDAFARRIARNTQSLLLEEAGVARVLDPAGGSPYVERLTEDLARTAWAWFQELEGGASAADRLAATRGRRDADIAHRRFPITGVSEFPNLAERLPVRPAGHGLAQAEDGHLPRVRFAEPYERLRAMADALPARPVVFLATIGPVAQHTARASFAANLFQAGGLATVTSGPGTDPEAIAEAYADSGTPVACLCSSDALYAEHAEAVATALRKAGAERIWLAGRGDFPGVDGTVNLASDALAVLRATFEDLGVRP